MLPEFARSVCGHRAYELHGREIYCIWCYKQREYIITEITIAYRECPAVSLHLGDISEIGSVLDVGRS
jgi:hypothetical protein